MPDFHSNLELSYHLVSIEFCTSSFVLCLQEQYEIVYHAVRDLFQQKITTDTHHMYENMPMGDRVSRKERTKRVSIVVIVMSLVLFVCYTNQKLLNH